MATEHDTECPVLYFLTINYYCGELIGQLADFLLTTMDRSTRLIVVNNSPGQNLLNYIKEGSAVKIINASCNLGFGTGCNLGIDRIIENDPNGIIWLLNPDAQLLPNATTIIRQILNESPDIGLLGTRICNQEGVIWFDKGTFNPWLGSLKHRFSGKSSSHLIGRSKTLLSEPSDWLSGCSLILNLRVLSIKPEFDPQIFLDYEDAELCLRLKQEGYSVRVTRDILVKHTVSAITGRAPRAKYRHATFSKLYLLHKHAAPLGLALNIIYFFLKPVFLVGRDLPQAQGRWAGLYDYIGWYLRQIMQIKTLRHPRTSFTLRS